MNVFIMDMLCMSPYYDHYLTKTLAESGAINVVLGSISFHYDTAYYRRNGVTMQPGIVDVVAKMRISNKTIRQAMKLLEYVVNLGIVRVLFLFKRPDIIHVQWIPLITKTSLELWFMRSMQKQGAKLIYTVHNTLPHDTGNRYTRNFARVYQTVDTLICHTESAKNELIDNFGIAPDKIRVIPLIPHGPSFGNSKHHSSGEAKTLLDIPPGKTVVLMFGILRPYKGADFLLAAWKHVVKNDSNALLVIAGNGAPSYIALLTERLAELNLGKNVRTYFRHIGDEEVPVFFAAADVLVYPYKEITQSAALLTGMSFGKAILATSLESFAETLENGRIGMLAPYGNAELFAGALMTLMKDSGKRKAFADGVAKVMETRYSPESIAKKTIECYRSTLDHV